MVDHARAILAQALDISPYEVYRLDALAARVVLAWDALGMERNQTVAILKQQVRNLGGIPFGEHEVTYAQARDTDSNLRIEPGDSEQDLHASNQGND